MDEYIPIKEVIKNKKVLNILNLARHSSEDSLLVERVEDNRKNFETFYIFIFRRNDVPPINRPDLVAKVARKSASGRIREYQIEMKRSFYVNQ